MWPLLRVPTDRPVTLSIAGIDALWTIPAGLSHQWFSWGLGRLGSSVEIINGGPQIGVPKDPQISRCNHPFWGVHVCFPIPKKMCINYKIKYDNMIIFVQPILDILDRIVVKILSVHWKGDKDTASKISRLAWARMAASLRHEAEATNLVIFWPTCVCLHV